MDDHQHTVPINFGKSLPYHVTIWPATFLLVLATSLSNPHISTSYTRVILFSIYVFATLCILALFIQALYHAYRAKGNAKILLILFPVTIALLSVVSHSMAGYIFHPIDHTIWEWMSVGFWFSFAIFGANWSFTANNQILQQQAELHSLRAQISPHFFFNTLQNIYSTNSFNTQKASEMILALADLMRYHMNYATLDLIWLDKEIDTVRHYIELEKLRLKPVDDVTMNIHVGENSFNIPPLIILTLIENCFKHGVGRNPCKIDIDIQLKSNVLVVTTKNKIQKLYFKEQRAVSNTGLANTKKRLELSYPGRHKLEIIQSEQDFTLMLEITFTQ